MCVTKPVQGAPQRGLINVAELVQGAPAVIVQTPGQDLNSIGKTGEAGKNQEGHAEIEGKGGTAPIKMF